MNVFARFDQSITKDHMARFSFTRTATTLDNLGVGGYDLPERAYSTDTTDNQFRVTENGPLGRRFFSESRLQVHWADISSHSLVEAPAVRVLDAFTRGGAQQAGVRDVLEFEAASDLDYVRGRHSFRDRPPARGRPVPHERRGQLPRDLHVREPERVRPRSAGELHATRRRSGDSVPQRPGRRVRPGRLPAGEEPDAVVRVAVRGADTARRSNSTSRRASR